MSSLRGRRILALAGTLLLALVITGCGRRADPAGAAAVTPGTGSAAPTAVARGTGAPDAAAPAPTVPTAPAWTQAPGASAVPPPVHSAAPAPFATPDLTAIQRLLDDLDAALGADATADTDEGSAK